MHQPRDLAAAALKSFGRSPDFTLNNFSFRLFSRLDAKAAYLLQQEQIRILDPRSKRNTWDVMAKRLSQVSARALALRWTGCWPPAAPDSRAARTPTSSAASRSTKPPASHTIDSWPAVDPSAGLLVYPGNDVVVRASDGVEFSFRKMYLSSASPELEKTLSDDPTLEKLNIPAEASVVEFFLQHVSPRQACPKISSFSISEEWSCPVAGSCARRPKHPIHPAPPPSLPSLWSLCKKYGTSGVLSFVLSQSTQFAKDYALSLLALAIVHDQPRVAYDALPEFDDKFQFLWDEDDGYNKFARPRFTLSDIPLRLLKQLPLVAVYALQRYQQWLYNPRNGRPKSWHGMRMKLQRVRRRPLLRCLRTRSSADQHPRARSRPCCARTRTLSRPGCRRWGPEGGRLLASHSCHLDLDPRRTKLGPSLTSLLTLRGSSSTGSPRWARAIGDGASQSGRSRSRSRTDTGSSNARTLPLALPPTVTPSRRHSPPPARPRHPRRRARRRPGRPRPAAAALRP